MAADINTIFSNVNMNNLGVPVGSWVFSTSGRNAFPAEDWIDPSEGLSYPKTKYPELAAVKSNWVTGENIVVPDVLGRFIRAKGKLATNNVDTLQGFAIKNITGKVYIGAYIPSSNIHGCLYWIDFSDIVGSTGGNFNDGVGFDASRVVPVADEVRPDAVTANLYLRAGTVKSRTEFLKLFEAMYPIGSIYTSVIDPLDQTASQQALHNPESYQPLPFGTWKLLTEAAGRNLTQIDRDDPDFAYAKQKGGNKNVVLTNKELPRHTHGSSTYAYQYPAISRNQPLAGKEIVNVIEKPSQTGETGEGQAFSVLNPYFTVLYYVRTA